MWTTVALVQRSKAKTDTNAFFVFCLIAWTMPKGLAWFGRGREGAGKNLLRISTTKTRGHEESQAPSHLFFVSWCLRGKCL